MSDDTLRQALAGFQNHLSADEKANFDKITSAAPTPADVVTLTKQIEEKNSRGLTWVRRMKGVLESVQQYCTIVDTFVQADPTIAALVWGSVKFLILMGQNFSGYFEKLSDMFDRFARHCPRLRQYGELFKGSQRVRDALSNFYTSFVVFCTKALKVFQKVSRTQIFKRALKSAWLSFESEFGKLEENLSAAKDELDAEIRLASEQSANNSREQQTIEYNENRQHRLLHQAEIKETRIHRSQQELEMRDNHVHLSQQITEYKKSIDLQIQKIVREEERQKIRLCEAAWSYDYTWTLRRMQRNRCPGTGSWLFQRLEFKEWVEKILQNYFWCLGPIGCGKTILTSYVVDHLATTLSDASVVYYFFDSLKTDSLSNINFLRSILHQILRPDMIDPTLQQKLQACFGSVNCRRHPVIDELEEIILTLICKLKRTFIVVDGIDEAKPEDKRFIIGFLQRVGVNSSIKIFVSSRPGIDIAGGARISLIPCDLESDIRTFIDFRLEECSQDLSICDPSLLMNIKQKLARKADGMFLWVDLNINEICSLCEEDGTSSRIPELLTDIPTELTSIYDRIFRRILHDGGQRTDIARRIFQWVLYARQPLSMSQLEEAATITADQKFWIEPDIKFDWPRLSKRCGSLLLFDEYESTISLAHHSIRQFLQSYIDVNKPTQSISFQPSEVNKYMGEVCIAYLCFPNWGNQIAKTPNTVPLQNLKPVKLMEYTGMASGRTWLWRPLMSLRRLLWTDVERFDIEQQLRTLGAQTIPERTDARFQLLEYCKAHWFYHCAFITDETPAALGRILQDRKLPFQWLPWNPNDLGPYPHWGMFNWAVREAHQPMLRFWRESVSENHVMASWELLWSKNGHQLFFSACATGNIVQTNILLESCHEIEHSKLLVDDISTALYKAAALGQIEIVERLLHEGADVNIIRESRSALQTAAESGYLSVVELLLKEKADVNGPPAERHGRTALQAAAGGGHLALVERLLHEKAGVNAPPAKFDGRTALQAAAGGGHLAVVERLLHEKADVNAPPAESKGRTALQAAAGGGYLRIVERLLQAGVDPTELNSALKDATSHCNHALVQILQAAGAKTS